MMNTTLIEVTSMLLLSSDKLFPADSTMLYNVHTKKCLRRHFCTQLAVDSFNGVAYIMSLYVIILSGAIN